MIRPTNPLARNRAALTLLLPAFLILSGCTTSGSAPGEIEPTVIEPEKVAAPAEQTTPVADSGSQQVEGEVPLAVAESEQPQAAPPEVVVHGGGGRQVVIRDLVAEGQARLRDVELQY